MRLEPLHHFVHVTKVNLKAAQETLGGIIIPPNVDAKASVFQVIAVGPGYWDSTLNKHVPMSVAVGDYVLLDTTALVNVSYIGKDCHIVPETGIFGRMHLQQEDIEVDSSGGLKSNKFKVLDGGKEEKGSGKRHK